MEADEEEGEGMMVSFNIVNCRIISLFPPSHTNKSLVLIRSSATVEPVASLYSSTYEANSLSSTGSVTFSQPTISMLH